MSIDFSTTITGVPKLKAKFRAINLAISGAMGSRLIENFLLARTKARFLPAGSTDTAQRDPEGRAWPRPKQATIQRKIRAGYSANPSQALVASRALVNAIRTIRRNTSLTAIRSSAGGTFVIGVNKSSPAYIYGRIQQSGGVTPRGGIVPARRYMGIGKGDVTLITAFLRNAVQKGVNA